MSLICPRMALLRSSCSCGHLCEQKAWQTHKGFNASQRDREVPGSGRSAGGMGLNVNVVADQLTISYLLA